MSKQSDKSIDPGAHAKLLSELIMDEIIYAFIGSRNRSIRRLMGPILQIPARHFGRIAADFYHKVNTLGIREGAKATLPQFNHTVTVRNIERVPRQGPVIIVSNHPGGLDSLGIVSCIPRNDLKALVSDVRFLRAFDILQRYFIYVSFETTGGMVALRAAIEHLRAGGALLVFAHGEVEPEPECLPGVLAAIRDWSPSLEIMLRKEPKAKIQIISTSGAVQSKFLNNPIARLRKKPERRQKLAEFLQVIQSVLLPRSTPVNLHLSMGAPMSTDSLGNGRWMPEIIKKAQAQMHDHLLWVEQIKRGNQKS